MNQFEADEDHARQRARLRGTGLSDGQLIAMGEVAYWAARAERSLSLVVATLVSKESGAGTVVTNGLAFGRLVELGVQLVRLRPAADEARDRFMSLVEPLKRAMDSRNHLLHSEWTRPREGLVSATLTRAKGPVERQYSLETIEDVASSLALLSNQLFLLYLVVEDAVGWEEWTPPEPD